VGEKSVCQTQQFHSHSRGISQFSQIIFANTDLFILIDLGGYPIASPSNHSVRREVIYRCGEPSQVTNDGITTMQRLGITHIYDLRSNNEIERAQVAGRGGVVEWEGCERVFVPVFTDKDYSPQNLAVRYKDYSTSGTEVIFPRTLLGIF
jgi:hypothetical protein